MSLTPANLNPRQPWNRSVKIFYIDTFNFPLPEGHTFPLQKYYLLREKITREGLIAEENFCLPHAATDEELGTAHDVDYIQRIQQGLLTPQEIRRIGFPWSPELVERSRRSCGATIEACAAAITDHVAVHLAGGTHHAFRNYGEGYCLFNDSAVASRVMQSAGKAERIIIIDCDVHKGNGTASILADDSTIFTFSIHGKKNFPFDKEKSDLDIALDDNTDDETYLHALERGLSHALTISKPDLAIYLAGADPYITDRFGRLDLTKQGLAERDDIVIDRCLRGGIRIAIMMAGGYAQKVDDTVDIHCQTVKTALEHEKAWIQLSEHA